MHIKILNECPDLKIDILDSRKLVNGMYGSRCVLVSNLYELIRIENV